MKKTTIGIIGGTGRMGQWFKEFFIKAGNQVLVSGRKTKIQTKDIARDCEVVILSTPYGPAQDRAREVGPLLSSEQLLTDFCSLKQSIVQAMAESTKAEVIGTHPLFGPDTASLQGQNVILCPAKGEKWLPWLRETMENGGARVTICEPETHDKRMALVQGLNHFLTVALGSLIRQNNVSPEELAVFTTPVFRMRMGLVGRLFAQDLSLYKDLMTKNPHAGGLVEMYENTVQDARALLEKGDPEKTLEMMEEVRDFLGGFCNEGLSETESLIRRLYELDR